MVRHGETDWNRENRFQGHADPPLNKRGRSQAQALAGELDGERFDAVYSSPLCRASETAAILVAARAVEVQLSDALREVDVGSWSGLTRTEVEERYPAGYRRWLEYGHGWDDGETYDALGRRVVSWLLDVGRHTRRSERPGSDSRRPDPVRARRVGESRLRRGTPLHSRRGELRRRPFRRQGRRPRASRLTPFVEDYTNKYEL